tara:strand:- start:3055 stop:3405 length:351 start_codon:yes stop_codon:yes gene_type:complete
MENSVFNIEPHTIKDRIQLYHYNFTFLDDIHTVDVHKYYQLLLSIDIFKIKNVYNFLFLRSLKLCGEFSTRKMQQNKYIQTHEEFNQELIEYIQKEKLYLIIIMNGIQQFFIPLNQ